MPTTLIVFSPLRWNAMQERPQQLLSRLASGWRVLFVEEPVPGNGPARLQIEAAAPTVEVLCAHTPLPAAGFHDDQLPLLRALLAGHLRAHGIDDYAVWFATPLALPLIDDLQPRAVVYDCMDELSSLVGAPHLLHQREAALLGMADLAFASGPSLCEARSGLRGDMHCLPSAVDAHAWSPATLDRDSAEALAAARLQAHIAGPRLGYCGAIDERIDLALLARLADARPDWQIVMAGPVLGIAAGSLPQRDNLHWLGSQPGERLAHLVSAWHVCLMPFKLHPAVRQASAATKALEYMAAEKPIASTALPDVSALYADVVALADDAPGFVNACTRLLGESGAAQAARVGAMRKHVESTSWDATAERIAALLEGELCEYRLPGALRVWPGCEARRLPSASMPINSDARAARGGERGGIGIENIGASLS